LAGGDEDEFGAAADDADLKGDDRTVVEGECPQAAGKVAALAAGLLGLGGIVLEVEPRWGRDSYTRQLVQKQPQPKFR
jgi:hypothetical protein